MDEIASCRSRRSDPREKLPTNSKPLLAAAAAMFKERIDWPPSVVTATSALVASPERDTGTRMYTDAGNEEKLGKAYVAETADGAPVDVK
jgi:hypothetical protein